MKVSVPAFLVRELHEANEERIASETKFARAALQLYEYLLGIETEHDREEHKEAARENEEPLLNYYANLLEDWQQGIDGGWIVDKQFVLRKEALTEVAKDKQTFLYPEEPVQFAKAVAGVIGVPGEFLDRLPAQLLMKQASNFLAAFSSQ